MFINIDIEKAVISTENSIDNVLTTLSQNGKKATVSFTYPRSNEYIYCFIYDVTDDEWNKGISLEKLIADDRNADIIDRRTPHDHVVELSRYGMRCILFPARYDTKSSTYYLLDQNRNNVTDQLRLLPTIRCAIRYEGLKTGFFKLTSSKLQRVIIRIGGDAPIPGTYLIYRCKGSERESIKFGIDILSFWNKELEIIIKKEEKIEFLPPKDNEYLLQV